MQGKQCQETMYCVYYFKHPLHLIPIFRNITFTLFSNSCFKSKGSVIATFVNIYMQECLPMERYNLYCFFLILIDNIFQFMLLSFSLGKHLDAMVGCKMMSQTIVLISNSMSFHKYIIFTFL